MSPINKFAYNFFSIKMWWNKSSSIQRAVFGDNSN
jgi:hypothetical protein